MKIWICVSLLFGVIQVNGFCYNTYAKIIFEPKNKPSNNSYFGYTTLLRHGKHTSLLVGAPRDKNTYRENSGLIYSCPVDLRNNNVKCSEYVLFDNIDRDQGNKDQMWLGMSMAGTTSSEGTFTACAPRWSSAKFGNDVMPGKCFTLPTTKLTTRTTELTPLLNAERLTFNPPDITRISTYGPTAYNYALGMAGFSSEVSKNGAEILMGAPGIFVWTGSVVRYAVDRSSYHLRTIPNPYFTPEIDDASYLGYSVGFGRFLSENKKELYVAGAPRGSNYKGEVYVFDFPSNENSPLKIKAKLTGKNIGEYFGSAIATIDINQDGLTDLIIGAPLYAEENTYDIGRVYVYINADKGRFLEQDAVVYGSYKDGARFGTSISEIGDINDDGYIDVAIGAPYEDYNRGAVYIYFGSSEGLNPVYVQRITFNGMSGFGISISKGVDIDNNSCKDIAVGAFMSDRVILLRCHPSIGVKPRITTSPEILTLNTTEFTAHICMDVQGSYTTDVKVNVNIDPTYKRAAFKVGSDETFIMKVSQPSACKDINIIMTSSKLDYSTPIEIKASYDLSSNPLLSDKFCLNCAVLRPSQSKELTVSVPVASGCVNNLACKPDLKLSVEPKFEIPYIIGSTGSIQLDLELDNTGDPAFLTVMEVVLPPKLQLSRVPSECSVKDMALLLCEMENPFIQKKLISLEFTTAALSNKVEKLLFNITAKSRGEELTPQDNNQNLEVALKSLAEIKIDGKTEPYIFLNGTNDEENRNSTHSFEIVNAGPSPLDAVTLLFFVPLTYDKLSLANILKFKATLGSDQIICDPVSGSTFEDMATINETEKTRLNKIYEEELSLLPTDDIPIATDVARINCVDTDKVACLILQCEVALNGKDANVNFTIEFNTTIIKTLTVEKKAITYTSYAMAKTPYSTKRFPSASIHTYFINSTYSKPAPIWLIALSIVIGIIALALLTYALYKYGFFDRKTRDELQLLKNQDPADNDDTTPD